MDENIRGNNVYLIKDTITFYNIYVRKVSGKYRFIGIKEEEAERKVIEYECEEFFCNDSYSDVLLRFYVDVVRSTLGLR